MCSKSKQTKSQVPLTNTFNNQLTHLRRRPSNRTFVQVFFAFCQLLATNFLYLKEEKGK